MIIEATKEELESGLKCIAAVIAGIPQNPVLPAILNFGGQRVDVRSLLALHGKIAKALYGPGE